LKTRAQDTTDGGFSLVPGISFSGRNLQGLDLMIAALLYRFFMTCLSNILLLLLFTIRNYHSSPAENDVTSSSSPLSELSVSQWTFHL
jgi:hypothetical protein